MRHAVTSYCGIVERWFPSFRNRLDRAAILPAKIWGHVELRADNTSILSDPVMTVHWEALPSAHMTEVCFEFGSAPFFVFDPSISARLRQRVINFRPDLTESLGTVQQSRRAFDLLNGLAIRNTVFEWLEDDLRRIDWAN